MTIDSAEHDRVLDEFRHAVASTVSLLQWRAVRVQSALDRDDHDPDLLKVITEDFAQVRDVLERALRACTDDSRHYSDGRLVTEVHLDGWDPVLNIAATPAEQNSIPAEES
jgi:hypothetical protein